MVIDDASQDNVYDYVKRNFPKVRLYKNLRNLRYSKTYNKGSRLAKGRFILHFNADALFTKETNIADVIEYMDSNPKVGMLGNLVLDYYSGKLDPDNRHQMPTLVNAIGQSLGLYKIFPNIKLLNYYMSYLRDDEIAEVGGVGGFMLFRRELLKNVGLLDENFLVYCQDSDFCCRTVKAGWKIIYFPKSTSIHLGGGSVKRYKIESQIIFHKDLWRYYKKNLINNYPKPIKYLVFLGLVLRFFVSLLVELYLQIKKFGK